MRFSKVIMKEDIERLTRDHRRSGLSRRDFIKTSLGALAAPLFLSCSNSPTEPSFEPRLAARPGTPSITPTPGLSQLGLAEPRDGLLYVPESYSPEKPAPLFIALHGAGGDSDNWASYYARAEARGMIFLAIDSRAGSWDLARGGFGPDVLFLDRALKHTFDRCRIDPTHLALAGFSDGASYALSLGVSNGDLFSQLIAYSPGFLAPDDPLVGKPRIFVAHGTQDTILPVSGSRHRIVPSLLDDDYDVTYYEFNGGHTVPAAVSEFALDWWAKS